jgi:hypothetical protein
MTNTSPTDGPDFIIIGAMKSATSTLQAQLAAQPGIFMTTPKEPNFFSDDDVFERGHDWYSALFRDAPQGALRGEASTHYTKLPTYPRTVERLAKSVPSPRLVYVIRNPIDRAVSHYMHEFSRGNVSGSFASSLAGNSTFIDYGRYAMQVLPFIETFGAEAIHLTSTELLARDPQAELDLIAAHIGARERLRWKEDIAPQNVSSDRVKRLPMHRLLVANPVARAIRQTIVPKSVRARIKSSRRLGDKPELDPELRSRLQAAFRSDHDQLARLFPGHRCLEASYPFI